MHVNYKITQMALINSHKNKPTEKQQANSSICKDYKFAYKGLLKQKHLHLLVRQYWRGGSPQRGGPISNTYDFIWTRADLNKTLFEQSPLTSSNGEEHMGELFLINLILNAYTFIH